MLMQVDWSVVQRKHILNACKLYDDGTELPLRPARNTFLVHSERIYPAKFILGTAYHIATGHHLDPSTDYSGGEEAARRLRSMGFEIKHDAKPKSTSHVSGKTFIATACIRGTPLTRQSFASRISLLGEIVNGICDRKWAGLSALVFPGGYFYLKAADSSVGYEDRKIAFDRTEIGEACKKFCRKLHGDSPGALIITGIDGPWRNQFCVAWTDAGVVGLARKVFPTAGEARAGLAVCFDDYRSPKRFVDLASGQKALLCSCYDAFGIVETPDQPTRRTEILRYIEQDGEVIDNRCKGFKELRNRCIQEWDLLMRTNRPTTSIAAIHQFEKPGREVFWQRHGIATASAAMRGGLAVGAAHFGIELPDQNRSTLASFGVPRAHLESAGHRKAHGLLPIDGFAVGREALVRLYKA
jgi:hypothetical protein